MVDSSKGQPVVTQDNPYQYEFHYPCSSHWDCTDYAIKLQAGTYLFQLYSASGGAKYDYVSTFRYPNSSCASQVNVTQYRGNTQCSSSASAGGAGGYVSGVIEFTREVQIYATIGGKGIYAAKISDTNTDRCYQKEYMIEGGYGGGGRAANWGGDGTGSGGGQTSVQLFTNDLWHRIIVSGGGGGADNLGSATLHSQDDGSGGAGGGLEGQGWWANGEYIGNYTANSTFGFTFGSGEAAQKLKSANKNGVQFYVGESDRPGAGGGWYGGFAGHHGNGGAGAGSSWALTKDAKYQYGNIDAHNEFYELQGSKAYAFDRESEFLFSSVNFVPGIWKGDGKLIITKYMSCNINKRADSDVNQFCDLLSDNIRFIAFLAYEIVIPSYDPS